MLIIGFDGGGRRIGTNADFTTSIGSSSESSSECSWLEPISIDEFIFIEILCADDGGLDDDGRDDAGDKRDELRLSEDGTDDVELFCGRSSGRPLPTVRILAKSYGMSGCGK